jgi:dynein light intermediate chain
MPVVQQPQSQSLLRFDPPVPVKDARKPRALNALQGGTAQFNKGSTAGTASGLVLEDILSAILPPQPAEAVGAGSVKRPQPPAKASSAPSSPAASATTAQPVKAAEVQYLQFVSAAAATRLDAIHLQEKLDARLVSRQAKETGLCSVRREIYTEAFDEVIRQVTVDCPERGLLLLRIRDEARMTIEACKTLFEGAHAFAVRKALIAEQGVPEMKAIIKQLSHDKAELEVRILELQQRCEAIEKAAADQRAQDEKQRNEELSFYHRTNRQLASQLKSETDKANSKK